jgi:signal transduction histidine kinase
VKDRSCWVDDAGGPVTLQYPSASQGRAVTVVRDAQGGPVAALVHDVALLEESTLLESVAGSMQAVLESHQLDAEVKSSRLRTVSAVESERHRIERDLHDGAQQRLIAIRMKLSVTGHLLEQNPARAALLVQELGSDVEAAIHELREFAHGVVPPLLAERGLGQALAEAARRAAIPTDTQVQEIGRCDPATESAIYFCCLEALQNAAKHAGPQASAQLALWKDGGAVHFSVEDNGAGPLAQGLATQGQGLANIRERMAAVGGQITIGKGSDGHFRVSGSIAA